MPDYKYLIVGGGMTGDAAIDGIREVDAEGSIGILRCVPLQRFGTGGQPSKVGQGRCEERQLARVNPSQDSV